MIQGYIINVLAYSWIVIDRMVLILDLFHSFIWRRHIAFSYSWYVGMRSLCTWKLVFDRTFLVIWSKTARAVWITLDKFLLWRFFNQLTSCINLAKELATLWSNGIIWINYFILRLFILLIDEALVFWI